MGESMAEPTLARLIDGKTISQEVMKQIADEVATMKKERGVVPGLGLSWWERTKTVASTSG